MKIHQLSLFLENSPGKAVEPCRAAGPRGGQHPHPDDLRIRSSSESCG